MEYYLAIDIGASSGRHIVGWTENDRIVYQLYDDLQRGRGNPDDRKRPVHIERHMVVAGAESAASHYRRGQSQVQLLQRGLRGLCPLSEKYHGHVGAIG